MTILELLNESVIVEKVKIGFPKDLPAGWSDFHQPMNPFGARWGRGVISKSKLEDGTYDVAIGGFSASHNKLRLDIKGSTMGTFYFGFFNNVLFLEEATIKFPIEDMLVKRSIAVALTSAGPLRGCRFKLS